MVNKLFIASLFIAAPCFAGEVLNFHAFQEDEIFSEEAQSISLNNYAQNVQALDTPFNDNPNPGTYEDNLSFSCLYPQGAKFLTLGADDIWDSIIPPYVIPTRLSHSRYLPHSRTSDANRGTRRPTRLFD